MPPEVLRSGDPEDAPRVTNLELFFDLVYVFAITQLSDFLFEHLTARGALQALVLFSAVWWAWNYTAWATNWVDPDRPATALMMIVLMALGLVMAAALLEAFESRGLEFAVCYVALSLVRTGFVAAAFPRGSPMRANNVRLWAWLVFGGVLWIAGGAVGADGDLRLWLWIAGAVIDLAAPMLGFWLPGVGSTPTSSWRLSGTHLAERYQLLLMIALGESVLRVGLTFSEHAGSLAIDAAFVVGFVASAALWASYFLRHAERGAQLVASTDDPARLGRSGYAYAHQAMVAGVIVTAVAIRSTIDDPEGASGLAYTLTALGGPALYLAGLGLFERVARLGSTWPPMAAIVLLALLAVVAGAGADRLILAVSATIVFLGLAVVIGTAPARARPPDRGAG